MKKEVVIKRLEDDHFIPDLVKMHQEIFSDNDLFGKLIYFDDNFPNYLKSILNSRNDYFFGVFSDDIISGFVHFKKAENQLFLNNIYLNENIRGGGTGTYIINYTLQKLLTEDYLLEYLMLDVFESNKLAKKWYEKIGLSAESLSEWGITEKKYKDERNKDSFVISKDDNGFTGLFLNERKVATIIQNESVIVHDQCALDYDSEIPFIYKRTDMETDFEEITFSKFDTSIRMKGKISTILEKIKCITSK